MNERQHPAVPTPDPDSPLQGVAKLREKLAQEQPPPEPPKEAA